MIKSFFCILLIFAAAGCKKTQVAAPAPEVMQQQQPKAEEVKYDGPFGLCRGLSRDQVISLVSREAVKQDDGYVLALDKVPSPSEYFERYVVFMGQEKGLAKIIAVGEDFSSDDDGTVLRMRFDQIKDLLSAKYGTPKAHYDFVDAGQPRDPSLFMYQLLKENARVASFWSVGDTMIVLEAKSQKIGSGYMKLTYEYGPEMDSVIEERKAKEKRSF